jgi:formylglycine-generating enzyme required for sulfatase activity
MTPKVSVIVALLGGCGLVSAAENLVRVPAGAYEVSDQITTLKVRVSVSEFLIGATEVTQEEFESLTGHSPSIYKGVNRPVENVSWWDAIRYCNLRSARERLIPCYDLSSGKRNPACTGYRLPTEAEWIRAATPRSQQEIQDTGNLGVSGTKSMAVFRTPLEQGTAPVRSKKPDALGISDLYGNVWEWCEDFFDAIASPSAVRDPSGPLTGVARVIRGGSFVSSTSRWSRDYRSSMRPDAQSRFTGFRVLRSTGTKAVPSTTSDTFFRPYNQAPKGFESSIGPLTDIATNWKERSAEVKKKWEALLREPKVPRDKVTARVIRDVSQRNFAGQMIELEMEPGVWEKVYVLRPPNTNGQPLPVMIVPFYDIDTPAAVDLGGRNFAPDKGVNAFAYSAAQHGYLAVAVRWFGESYGESYSEAVANLALRHPGSTGLGKWIADARKVVDFIETLPDADAGRIGIIGHSLGGKMALYAAAFEPRIRAVVSSELGVGFAFSNYEDYWYLGDQLATAPAGTDQHELIGLIAPRPFLLIGGDEYDKEASWHYINSARRVYELYGKHQNVGYFNHHTGHTPSPESVSLGFDWLDHFLQP